MNVEVFRCDKCPKILLSESAHNSHQAEHEGLDYELRRIEQVKMARLRIERMDAARKGEK